MTYQFLSGFHIVSAISALIFGLCVLLTRKGTRLHKQVGYAYFFNMLGLNVSAMFIYRLTGHFGPFHGAALASLLTLMAGFTAAYLRLPQGRWLELHYEFMNWSYAGLVAAAVSEATTRLPAAPFWPAVFAGTLIVFLMGGILIAKGRGKYNFERMASAKRSAPPVSLSQALERRRAICH
ncbi:MAG TPA: DUF2306 domain-containing protein [Anaerolineales bacterium]|jgi:uncharacterized membrane protein|nr:DUF2306 domain-containing protein [Anaerolineales bacterium]